MNITTEYSPEREAIVTVEIDAERLQRAIVHASQTISRVRPMPGFRPGKAPLAVVEQAVGKDLLLDEALEELSHDLYREILKSQDLDPVDRGRSEVVQKDPPILKFTVPLRPEVKLGDYQTLQMRPPEVTITEDEVDQVIARFQLNQATIAPVTREVRASDVVTMDIKGGVPDQEPQDQKNVQFAIADPNRPGLPFDGQLLGMMPGETREIAYTYPDDYQDESLRAKTAQYSVTVHEIKETQLPELSDEFAQAISQFKTLEQFKGNVREVLSKQKERDTDRDFTNQVLDAIIDMSQITFPRVVLAEEIDHQLVHFKDSVAQLGLTWPKYLELTGRTEEGVRTELEPAAEKNLKRLLTMVELAKAEGVQVTREELDADIERRVQSTVQAGGKAQVARRSYNTPDARRDLETNLRLAKGMSKIIARVKGEAVSGRILTPEMVKDLETPAIPSGLITDPSTVRSEDWPKGL